MTGWPESTVDPEAFWAQGQVRSTIYESALREILPGYNSSSEGFLRYRPDYIVKAFRPCSIVEAVGDSQEAINAAIRRDAHVFEFTAMNSYSESAVMTYIAAKLDNYVQITQEQ